MKDKQNNLRVINYSKKLKKFINLSVRDVHFGLKKNIIEGINFISKRYSKFIILEDDLYINKNTINFFVKCLVNYKNDKNIFTITAYNFPDKKVKFVNEDLIKNKRPCSWGWASWSKKWKKISFNKNFYKKILKSKENIKKIEEYGNDLPLILKKTLKNEINSWAIYWAIYHIIKKKYCIYPKYSFINELGFKNHASNNFFKSNKFHHNHIKPKIVKNFYIKSENRYFKKLLKEKYDLSKIKKFYYKLILSDDI